MAYDNNEAKLMEVPGRLHHGQVKRLMAQAEERDLRTGSVLRQAVETGLERLEQDAEGSQG